ncbi:MAG: hypothetical protein ACI9M3_001975 [Bacteroidia bacterium]|jgi:hypothetical protein
MKNKIESRIEYWDEYIALCEKMKDNTDDIQEKISYSDSIITAATVLYELRLLILDES